MLDQQLPGQDGHQIFEAVLGILSNTPGCSVTEAGSLVFAMHFWYAAQSTTAKGCILCIFSKSVVHAQPCAVHSVNRQCGLTLPFVHVVCLCMIDDGHLRVTATKPGWVGRRQRKRAKLRLAAKQAAAQTHGEPQPQGASAFSIPQQGAAVGLGVLGTVIGGAGGEGAKLPGDTTHTIASTAAILECVVSITTAETPGQDVQTSTGTTTTADVRLDGVGTLDMIYQVNADSAPGA